MSKIEYAADLTKSRVTPSEIEANLPNWKTRLLEIYEFKDKDTYEIRFLIPASTQEEIKQWLEAYEEKTKTSYSITCTEACAGLRVQFKRRMHCRHNTSCSKLYDPSPRNRSRNVNCPSRICITLFAIHKRYQGKNKSKAPDPNMPCEIKLIPTHNHSVGSLGALRFRAVHEETQKKLIELYKRGHTARSALKSLKMDIRLNEENHERLLVDRKFFPDYMYSYNLYQGFKKKHGPFKISKEFLTNIVAEYNGKFGRSAAIEFRDDDYVICLCPPLFRRVHENIEQAAEVVYMESISTADHEGSGVYVLLTHGASGGLPLGIIVTSQESTPLITLGFQLLKTMLGDEIFHGMLDGPSLFLIDDSAAIQSAIQTEFKGSTSLLCMSDVRQSMLRWLLNSINCIPKQEQQELFQEFKAIMYAQTTADCELMYNEALISAKKYKRYLAHLEQYWQRKEFWALSYRDQSKGDHVSNNFSEALMRLLREKFFEDVKAFNLAQLLDFLLTKFTSYYVSRIIDGAHNRLKANILGGHIKRPSSEIIANIQNITDDMHMVPSEKVVNLFYIVNSETLECTCDQGGLGKMCKHICWVCCFLKADEFLHHLDDEDMRRKFFTIAEGREPPKNWLSNDNDPEEVLPQEAIIDETVISLLDNSDKEVVAEESEIPILAKSEQDLVVDGDAMIKSISSKFSQFLKKSPPEASKGLEAMLHNMKNIKTVDTFTAFLHRFGSGVNQNLELSREGSSKKQKLNLEN